MNQVIPGIENQQVRRCSPGEHCVKTSRRGSNCVPGYSGIFRYIPGCAAVFHDPRHSCRACLARDAAHRHIVAMNSEGPDVSCVKCCHFNGLQTYIGGIRRLSGCDTGTIDVIPAKSLSSPVAESRLRDSGAGRVSYCQCRVARCRRPIVMWARLSRQTDCQSFIDKRFGDQCQSQRPGLFASVGQSGVGGRPERGERRLYGGSRRCGWQRTDLRPVRLHVFSNLYALQA